MSSKYKSKQPKPVTKQSSGFKEAALKEQKRAYCTNCGRQAPMLDLQYSKCYCGGTFQTYGVK